MIFVQSDTLKNSSEVFFPNFLVWEGGFCSRAWLLFYDKAWNSESPPMGAPPFRVGSWTKAPGYAGGCFTV